MQTLTAFPGIPIISRQTDAMRLLYVAVVRIALIQVTADVRRLPTVREDYTIPHITRAWQTKFAPLVMAGRPRMRDVSRILWSVPQAPSIADAEAAWVGPVSPAVRITTGINRQVAVWVAGVPRRVQQVAPPATSIPTAIRIVLAWQATAAHHLTCLMFLPGMLMPA